jgi:hypothetical protein
LRTEIAPVGLEGVNCTRTGLTWNEPATASPTTPVSIADKQALLANLIMWISGKRGDNCARAAFGKESTENR